MPIRALGPECFFLPRHLQRFWGASGHFWQAQWERLLLTFEGKEWFLFTLGEVPSQGSGFGYLTTLESFFLMFCSLLWAFAFMIHKDKNLEFKKGGNSREH